MSEFTHTRRRIDSGIQDKPSREDDNAPVQFFAPYESQDRSNRPEPLALSKINNDWQRLKLDKIDSGYSNENDQEDGEDILHSHLY